MSGVLASWRGQEAYQGDRHVGTFKILQSLVVQTTQSALAVLASAIKQFVNGSMLVAKERGKLKSLAE